MKFKQTLPPHKSLIKSEGMTSTFSQALRSSNPTALAGGPRCLACCRFMLVLDGKKLQLLEDLLTLSP